MKLVGRDVEMNQVRQVGNVSWQSDELIVAQVKLCQMTKVPQRRAQVCDTPYITHMQSLTIQCHIITYQYSTPGNCVRSFYSYHVQFVYLGSLVHSSTQSSPDISRRNAITRACGYAESRQTDLEVKNHHSNQAKVV